MSANDKHQYPHTQNHNSKANTGSVAEFGSIDPNKDVNLTEGNENAKQSMAANPTENIETSNKTTKRIILNTSSLVPSEKVI